MEVFEDIEELKALYLKTSNGKKIEIMHLDLMARVGATPTCYVRVVTGTRIASASTSVFKNSTTDIHKMLAPGTNCEVCCTIDGLDTVLYKGRVSGIASTHAANATAVAAQYVITLAFQAEFIDSVPTAATSIISSLDTMSTQKSSFGNIAGKSYIHAVKNSKSPEVNIAEYIRDILDGICYGEDGQHIKTVAGGSANISDAVITRTCPAMSLRISSERSSDSAGQSEISTIIAKDLIGLLERGYNYWTAFVTMCSKFFLTVVPELRLGVMSVLPALAWKKKIDLSISPHHIISDSCVVYSKGRNEVDAVIVGYNELANPDIGTPMNPAGCVVYGEGIVGNKPCAITDPKLLVNPSGPPRKYITKMVPTWIMKFGEPSAGKTKRTRNKKPQDRVCSVVQPSKGSAGWDSFALKWASMIARTTFAQLNRAQAQATLRLRFSSWLSVKEYLGKIVSFDPPDNFLAEGQTLSTYVGMLDSVRLSIDIGPQQLSINATATLTHVRTKEENDILGIEESVYVK